MNKKIFTLLLLVFVLISMSAVSSADLDDTVTLSLDSGSDVVVASDTSSSIVALSDDSSNAVTISNDNSSDVLEKSNDDEILGISDSDDDVLGLGSEFYTFDCPSTITEGDSSSVSFVLWDEWGMEIGGATVWLNVDGTNTISTTSGEEGDGTLSLSSLTAGTHQVKCVFEGTSQYDPSESSTQTVTVNERPKTSLQLDGVPHEVTVTEGSGSLSCCVVNPSDDYDGVSGVRVKLTAGDAVVYATSTGVYGEVTFDLSSVTAGSYTAVVVVDDSDYTSSSANIALTVNPKPKTSVHISNDNAITEVTMTEGDARSVGFFVYDVNNIDYVSGVRLMLTAGDNVVFATSGSNGVASFDLSGVSAGTYRASIVVNASDYVSSDTLYFDLTVNEKAKTSVWFEQSTNVPSSMDQGDDVSVGVIVYSDEYSTPMTSPVRFKLTAGSNTLYASSGSSGIATFDLSTLTAGSHDVTIVVDDSDYKSSDSVSFHLDVNGDAPVTGGSFAELASLFSSSDTITLDKDYKYVSGDPTYFEYGSSKTIYGNGHIIDASSLSSIYLFHARAPGIKLTLRDVTIANGNFSNHVLDSSQIDMNNVSVIGVTTTSNLIYATALNIQNSKFINNTANGIIYGGSMEDYVQKNVFLNNTISGYVLYGINYAILHFDNNVLINSKNDYRIDEEGESSGNYYGTDGLTINGPDEINTASEDYTFALSNSNLPEFDLLVDITSEYASVTPTVVTLGGGKTATLTVNAKEKGNATLTVGSDLVCAPVATKDIQINYEIPKTSVVLADFTRSVVVSEGDVGDCHVIVYDNLDDYNPVGGVRVKLTAGDSVVYATSNSGEGKAAFDLSGVPVGNYAAVAVVDDDYYKSNSVNISLTVNEKPKTSVVLADFTRSVVVTEGDVGDCHVIVYDNLDDYNPVGGVRVKLTAGDSVVYATSNSGEGKAAFDLSGVPVGNYTAVAVVDDENYQSNSVNIALTVNEKPKTLVYITDVPVSVETVQGKGTFSVKVVNNESQPVGEGIGVKTTIDGIVLNAATNDEGVATFYLSSVPVGNYTPVVVVDDDAYKSDEVTFALTVNVPPTELDYQLVNPQKYTLNMFVGDSQSVIIKFVDVYSGDPVSEVEVYFNLNNTITTNTTGENGSAYFDLSTLDEGQYTLVVDLDNVKYNLYNPISFTINVNKHESYLTADRFGDDNHLTINVGDNVLLNAALVDFDTNEPISDATIVFLFNDTEYTNVTDAEGNAHFDLSGIAVGEYIVNYRFDETRMYTGDALRVNDQLTVSKISTEISVTNDTLDLIINDEADAGATLTPADAGSLSFTSSNESIAIVENGKIKALAAGSAIITVSFEGSENYTAAESKTITVTVSKKVVAIDASDIDMTYGDDETLTATFTYNDESVEVPVAVTVNGDAIDNMTSTGGQIAFDDLNTWAAGTYTVNLTVNTAEYKGNKVITVNIAKADVAIDVAAEDVVYGEDVIVLVTGSVDGDYSVTVSGVAKDVTLVAGEASSVNFGVLDADTYEITVNFAETGNYNAAVNDTESVAVSKADVVIDVVAEDVVYGEDVIVEVTGSVDGDYSVTVSGVAKDVTLVAGEASSVNFGVLDADTYEITVNFAETGNYNAAVNDTETVTVDKAHTTINVEQSSVSLEAGKNQTTGATLVPAEAGELTYVSSNTTVAYVENGLIIANHSGNAVITVSFAGNDNYAAADSMTIDVSVDLAPASVSASDIALYVNSTATINPVTTPDGLEVEYESADPTIAEVDANGVVTSHKGGNTTITIKTKVDGIHAVNSTVINVTVNKLSSEITLENTEITLNVNDEVSTGASLVPTEGNLIYDSSNIAVACVENGLITANAEGTVVITVSYAGDDYYIAAEDKTITVTVNLNDASVSVNNATLDLKVDDIFTIVPTITPEGLDVTYVPDDSGVVSVENGVVTALKEGTASIVVKVGGDGVYAENSTTVTVTVSKVPTEIGVANATLDLEVLDEVASGATLTPADAGNVTYTVSNSSVVKVEGGKIIALAEGTATVTVSFDGDDKYAVADSKTISVTVNLKDSSVSINNETLDLLVDDVFTIVPTTTPEGLDVTYVPDDSGVVSVENGVVTALKEGTASIIVSVGDDVVYAKNTTTISVTVSKVPTEISVENATIELEVLDEVAAGVALTPADAGNVTYTVSNSSVVKFEDGMIIALANGTATITVSYNGTDKYAEAESKTIEVTVNLKDASVSVENTTLELLVGENTTIVGVTTPEGLDVTYVPDDSGVYSIDDNGVVTALKEGTGSILVKVGGNGVYAENSTTVSITVSKVPTEISVENATIELEVLDEVAAGVALTPADAGDVAYAVSDDSVVKVEDGMIIALANGTATITVSYNGTDKYAEAESKTIEVTVNLKDASVSVNNETLDLKVDDTFTMESITVPGDLNVTYIPDDSGVFEVDENGVVTALKDGTGSFIVSVGDDKVYAKNNVTVTVTVSKIDTVIDVDSYSLNLKVDELIIIDATLTPADAGNVTFTSSDDSIVTVDKYGTVTAVGAGNATITVSYNGTDKYNPASDITVDVTVSKIDTNISVASDSLDLKVDDEDTVVVTLTPDDAGNVTFTSSNTSVVTVDKNGNVKAVGAGEAVITVSYAGDDKYNAASDIIVDVTVSLNDASVSAEDIELYVGDNATIVAVTIPDGLDVTYVVDNSGVVTVENGVVTAVKVGTASVTLTVGGDGKYAENSTTITVTVSKVPTEISVDTVSLDLFVGDEHTIVAKLTPADAGNVTFKSSNDDLVLVEDDGNVIANGEGQAIITISFAGNDKYAAAENKTISVTVRLNDASVTVDNDTLDLKVDETYAINATKHPDTILLDITYTSSNSSVATVDKNGVVTAVGEGTAIITVSVGDGEIYAENSTNVTVTVSKVPTEIAADSALDLFVGDDAVVNATLTPDAGELDFTSSDVSVVTVNGIGEVTAVGDGTATITIKFYGNDKYAASEVNVTVTVSLNDASVAAEDIALDVGANASIVATTTPEGLNINYVPDNSGVVTVENGVVTAVKEGTASVTLTVGGDGKYAKNSTTITVTVTKSNATMNVTAPEVTEGENATLTVTLPEDATGNVTATVGGKTYTAPVENGTATLIIQDLAAGNNTVPVTYSGDDKYSPLTEEVTVTVDEETSIIVSAPGVEKFFSGSERFVVNVTDAKGSPVANKTAVITINGVSYTRKTNANGTTSIPLGLPAGVYNVTTVVDNETVNSVATIKTTVNGTDIIKVFRNGTQYYATFRDSEGNYLAEGSEVEFNINGVFYTRTVKENGLAKLNINLEQGEYIITAINKNTTEKSSNNITVISRLIENNDLTKYFRNASQYTVKVIGDDGKAVGAGVEVTFNINGVFYTRTTNALGIAKLNINLEAGDYIITAEYAGCKVSNHIKVLPILNATDLTKKFGTRDQFVATLVDGQGNPYSGQKVEFNINGVFYYRTTDDAGNAKLNINLQPGEYIITSSYGGCNIANTVKVNA